MTEPIKILNVHGYLGSANGHSSELIRNEFASRGIPILLDAPGFSVTNSDETKEKIKRLIHKENYDYIVASSLGAFYSMQIPGIKKILINIALPENLKRIRDLDTEHNPELSEQFVAKISREKETFFSEVFDESYRQETYVIYGTRDEIAPNEEFFKQYYTEESRVFHIDMEHKLDAEGAKKVFEIISMDSKGSAH